MHGGSGGGRLHGEGHPLSSNRHNNNRRDADEQEVWVQQLWLRHCSAIADSVNVHDAAVHNMWDLFQPLLLHLPLIPMNSSRSNNNNAPTSCYAGHFSSAQGTCSSNRLDSTSDCEETDSSRIAITHILVVDLRSVGNEDDMCGVGAMPAARLTQDMRVALHEQPTITLCLLEFFASVMHVQRCEEQQQQQRRMHQSIAVEKNTLTRMLRATTPRKQATLFTPGGTSNAAHDTRKNNNNSGGGSSSSSSSSCCSSRTCNDTNKLWTAQTSSDVSAMSHSQHHQAWLRALASVLRVYCTVLGDAAHSAPFDHVGAAQLDSLITVKGTVVRLSPSRIMCTHVVYQCERCGAVQPAATPDGVLIYPGSCKGRCRGYRWTPLPAQSVCEEVQTLKLQEHVDFFDAAAASASATADENSSSSSGGGNSSMHGGAASGMNKVMEVHLRVPWLNCVTVGDTVCVCGVLRCRRDERKSGGSGAQQLCVYARSMMGSSARQGANTPTTMTAMMRIMMIMGSSSSNGSSRMFHLGGGVPMPALPKGLPESTEFGCPNTFAQDTGHSDRNISSSNPDTATSTTTTSSNNMSAMMTSPFGLLPHGGGSGSSEMLWSAQDSALFYELVRHPRWFARLVSSVAPGLYGMEMVKQAILLAIVGGSTQKLGTRSNIHLLLLGDPGLGKSQLLRAACAVAPRSAFVCAHTSSSCGLTLTLTRDPVTGEATFAAGAVVHGDGGVTCIDEMDKGASEHKALLEVMESERVSMAKAGSVFSMPVHTSVLAAGNPVGGRFDLSKSIAANVNMSLALLSRFDIIVCLRDSPLRSSDNLTSHVLQLHRRPGYKSSNSCSIGSRSSGANNMCRSSTKGSGPYTDCYTTSREDDAVRGSAYLSVESASTEEGDKCAAPLPHELVQRFIFFCKTQCQPILRVEACEILKAHYLSERARMGHAATALGAAQSMELPVTPRYLQALIRVAEARAKVDLRHEVTREDARYAVELLQSCLRTFDVLDGADSVGGRWSSLATRSGGGGAGGRAKKCQRDCVVDILKADIVCNGGVNRLSHRTILAACEEAGCKNPSAMMHQLNEVGVLLQCGDKYTLRGV